MSKVKGCDELEFRDVMKSKISHEENIHLNSCKRSPKEQDYSTEKSSSWIQSSMASALTRGGPLRLSVSSVLPVSYLCFVLVHI